MRVPGPFRLSRDRGMTLLEVMIAVFVLAVAILGIGALQIMSKRSNQEALQRTTASILAHDIIERIRTNAPFAANYAGTVGGGSKAGVTRCYDGADCFPQDLVESDLSIWEAALDGADTDDPGGGTSLGGLVRPTGCIEVTPATAPDQAMVTVSIAWRGMTALSDPVIHTCGQGTGKYDTSDGTPDDLHRRVLTVSSYVTAWF